jgi:hypothetical protein
VDGDLSLRRAELEELPPDVPGNRHQLISTLEKIPKLSPVQPTSPSGSSRKLCDVIAVERDEQRQTRTPSEREGIDPSGPEVRVQDAHAALAEEGSVRPQVPPRAHDAFHRSGGQRR